MYYRKCKAFVKNGFMAGEVDGMLADSAPSLLDAGKTPEINPSILQQPQKLSIGALLQQFPFLPT